MQKWTSVQRNMIFQGLLRIKSRKSCSADDFWVGGGLIRSLVVKNVIMKTTKQSTDQMVMVICQPYCGFSRAVDDEPAAAWLSANLATSGRVKPPTMNCAMLTETKRYEFRLAR